MKLAVCDRSALPTAELDAEHAQKVLEMEHSQQVKLKERQKFFEEAFQQDMEQYLSTGYLQIAERRDPEPDTLDSEVTLQVPTRAELHHESSSYSSTATETEGAEETSEEGSASPVVQSDEEEVQADTVLETLPDSEHLVR
ncbi:hypothetical protein Z043_108923 [Scleropages formosus]|uniref:Dysbindin-like n=1 Tax=Scleropages formosus TaxID=113540 RepID=A0A0P7VFH2_SCLFO|nr:hypothetical protein Z043_108923 [Scleropages formosus]